MSNTPFQFPPPPPPPPRRDAQVNPTFQQSNYPHSQPGRGRGRGNGLGVNRGGPNRPHRQGRANYRSDNTRGGYERSGGVNTGAYAGNHGSQQPGFYAGPYGQTNNASARGPSYTSDWNQATRGGTTASHGFHHNGPNGTRFPSLDRLPSQGTQPQNAYPSSTSSNDPQYPRKRPFSTAFTKPLIHGPRPQAAPAVPSFNASIPLSLPSKPVDLSPSKTKKPRKHNQLGLTPASQGHESSSDDDNEEAKLRSRIVSSTDMVQFEYNGRTATLRTAAEIAAWIAERKKKYPTQAKAEAAKKEAADKKRKWAEVKKQKEDAAKAKRLDREKQQQEELRLKALESKNRKNVDKEQKIAERGQLDEAEEDEDHAIKAKKARIKANKLRLKAEKAELKVLEAEVEARKARKRRASQQNSAQSHSEMKAQEIWNRDADSAIALEGNYHEGAAEADGEEDETVSDIHQDIHEIIKNKANTLSTNKGEDDEGHIPNSPAHSLAHSPGSPLSISDSSALSDSEPTSPSASSSSESDSDSAPEQTTSKRLEPTRVPPPPRRQPINTQHLCRSLLATGHCQRGAECSYSHDLPDTLPPLHERKEKLREKRKARLGKANAVGSIETGSTKKERRKGLWQIMVEKEQEEERKQVLKAIVFMGQKGILGKDEQEHKAGGEKGAV